MMRRFFCVLLINVLISASIVAGDDTGLVIRGKVTDISGNALAGAGVTVADSFIGIHTNSDGTYVIKGLKEGSLFIILFIYWL